MPESDIEQCVLRIVNYMGISEKTKRHAIKILEKIKKTNHLGGKDPMGITAAVLYIAANYTVENIPQRKFAKAAMITEVTLRNRCKGLRSLNLDLVRI